MSLVVGAEPSDSTINVRGRACLPHRMSIVMRPQLSSLQKNEFVRGALTTQGGVTHYTSNFSRINRFLEKNESAKQIFTEGSPTSQKD